MKKLILLTLVTVLLVSTTALAVPTVIVDEKPWVQNYIWEETGSIGMAVTDYYSSNGVTRYDTGGQAISGTTIDGQDYTVFHVNAGTYTGEHEGWFDKGLWGLTFYGSDSPIGITMTDLNSYDGSTHRTAFNYISLTEYEDYFYGSENFGNTWLVGFIKFDSFFSDFDPLQCTDYLVEIQSGQETIAAVISVGQGGTPAAVPAPGAIILGSIGAGLVGLTRSRKRKD